MIKSGGINWETQTDICKLEYIKQMMNKNLLYQHRELYSSSVMTYMGEEA